MDWRAHVERVQNMERTYVRYAQDEGADDMDLKGTVALVTGGASGLGEATGRRFIAAGARVVLVDVNKERGRALAKELGHSALFVQADVADEDAVHEAVDTACSYGSLRVAVNCAGVGLAKRTLNRDGKPHSLELFEKIVRVNLIGSFNVLRLAAAAMSKTTPLLDTGERGVIINTASVAAYDGQIGQAAYAASKGGVVGMTLPIARDLAPIGIRVVTIAPGVFDTPILEGLSDKVRKSLTANIPFPSRMGDVQEFAHFVQAIVNNPYVNGETIRLDGGLRMAPK